MREKPEKRASLEYLAVRTANAEYMPEVLTYNEAFNQLDKFGKPVRNDDSDIERYPGKFASEVARAVEEQYGIETRSEEARSFERSLEDLVHNETSIEDVIQEFRSIGCNA